MTSLPALPKCSRKTYSLPNYYTPVLGAIVWTRSAELLACYAVLLAVYITWIRLSVELCCLYSTHFFITAKLAQHPSPLLPRWLGSSARMLVSQGTLWLMFHSQTCANWLQAAFCGGVPCTHISWGHIFRQIYLAPPVFRRFLSIPTFFNLSIMTAEVVLHLFLGSHECPNLYRLS
jgi:hypothetical protein